MKLKFLLFCSFTFLGSTFLLQAQDIDTTQLNEYFNVLETNDKFMGNVAVSKGEKIIYQKSLGFADREQKLPISAQTKFRIGSITKSFTAVLVLQSVENKLLQMDQTLDTFFPQIQNADKITLRHMLQHRSGIHNLTNDKEYLEYYTQPKNQEELLDIIVKGGSDFEPDSKSEYSNSNYLLLTFILEKIHQKSYEKLLEENIFQVLGLENTYYGSKINSANNVSHSYYFNDTWQKAYETDMSIPRGAGAIVSNAEDLSKFSYGLFKGKLLKDSSLEMMKELKDNYGLGLFAIPFYEKMGYGHAGAIDGFYGIYTYFPSEDITLAFTSNGSAFSNNDVTIAVLSAIFQKPFQVPSFTSMELKSEDLDVYLGTYASASIPLKITISKNENQLIAQATGQGPIPLVNTVRDRFEFSAANIVLEFVPQENKMSLMQGGGKYIFIKE